MNSFQKRLALPVITGAFLATSACSTIVRHPDVDGVKKIAIVSLYTNQDIGKVGAKSGGNGGLAMLTKLAKGKDEVSDQGNGESANRVRLAKYAYDKFRSELAKVPGWQVVSIDSVVGSNEYQALGKMPEGTNRTLASIGTFAQNFSQAKWNTPPKMWAIDLEGNSSSQKQVEGVKSLCKTLGVDGVAVIHVDLAYEAGALNIGGTGAGYASVASSMKLINKNGKYAVDFGNVAPGAGERIQSDNKLTMIGGKIFMMNETQTAFEDAIDKSAAQMAKVIVDDFHSQKTAKK